jgi:hypothetical protein
MGKEITMEDKKLITPKFRVSFPQVNKPKAFDEDQDAKYSVTMLYPKKSDIKPLLTALTNAAVEKWGEQKAAQVLAKIKPDPKKYPIRDGDKEKEDLVGYAGNFFCKASSKSKPGLIDKKKNPILDEDDFYAGCYARAELIAFAYDNKFGKGVGFSLQNIQKLDDGEKFSGRKDAELVFDEVEDTSDDEGKYGDSDDEDEIDLE